MSISFNKCVLIFTLIFAFNTGYAAEKLNETEKVAENPGKAEEATTSKPLSLTETYTLINTLPKKLLNLRKQINDLANTKVIFARIQEVSSRVGELEWETTVATTTPDLNPHQLLSLDTKLTKIDKRITQLSKRIESNIHTLEILTDEWLANDIQLQKFIEHTSTQAKLVDTLPTADSLDQIIEKAQQLIEEQIHPTLLAGKKIGEIQARVYTLNDTVNDLLQDMYDFGFQQNTPSMLSAGFYSRFEYEILTQSWENLRFFGSYQKAYLKNNFRGVLIFLATIALVTFLTRLSKPFVKASYRWHPFTDKPFATGIFIVSTTFLFIEALHPNIDLPPNWQILQQILMIVAAVFLAEYLIIKVPLYRTTSSFLFFSLTVIMFLQSINLPQPLVHLYLFGVSIICLTFSFRMFFRRKEVHQKRKYATLRLFFFLFPLVVFLAGAGGYEWAAVLIFDRVMSIIVITLVVWLIQKILSGLFELILYSIPVPLVRQNAAKVVHDITPALILVHSVLWFSLVLSYLSVFPTLGATLSALASIEFSFFSHIITPKSILVIIFALYVTFLTSRGINTFLIQGILPRYRITRGVQESITRLVHYSIIVIGFLVLLKLLGFELGDIAIIGGALGVGIGFGLKEIVNNFVSGLILLFERPVKVGDIIVVGQDMGEVTALGLRATTVQTFDNAEIVIPNAELIIGSVTNWTLAEKRVRVKIPIGVAYGTDISIVLKILLSCADSNPTVLTMPPPRALFLAFGDSSLNFELRVWISDFSDHLTVRSELNQDIEAEFEMAGVVIPFPQRDLHLKSVDPDAIKAFQQATMSGNFA
ncbi:mechanosensitive ion channel domain-containing protein [Desulfogranum marinum]|uniref:mechanosensitive ion channel family protein n=1 Tax=Desulfogranum marinum TaxID=453220 RepID=UPI0029C91266|nr:mechanosensitive ion channel domain-containing protein [Desulfogranum marinum]